MNCSCHVRLSAAKISKREQLASKEASFLWHQLSSCKRTVPVKRQVKQVVLEAEGQIDRGLWLLEHGRSELNGAENDMLLELRGG